MKSLLTAICLLSATILHAEVPFLINYQGLLTDINGNVVSGSKTVSISIHDAATDGAQLYAETIGSVTVQNGVYSFQFGAGPNFATALATGSQHWLQVTLDGIAQTPRERLVSVPFAMRARVADAAIGVLAEQINTLNRDIAILAGGITSPNILTETFPTAVGANNTVLLGDTTMEYRAPSYSCVSDTSYQSETVYDARGGYTLYIPAEKVIRGIYADFVRVNGVSGNQVAKFNYSDGTAVETNEIAMTSTTRNPIYVQNPQPAKAVTSIKVSRVASVGPGEALGTYYVTLRENFSGQLKLKIPPEIEVKSNLGVFLKTTGTTAEDSFQVRIEGTLGQISSQINAYTALPANIGTPQYIVITLAPAISNSEVFPTISAVVIRFTE
jgi:hypothetical protein